jgi:Holliday junction resolvase RusA-like endonuclease
VGIMILFIPIKPLSVNKAWQGRRFKSKDYKKYETDVCLLLPIANKTVDTACEVVYRFYLKNHKMTDADNLIKPLQDIIVKLGYIKDDRLIWKYTIMKFPCTNGQECIQVEIN